MKERGRRGRGEREGKEMCLSSEAKVANLDVTMHVEENVAALDVAMDPQ